jgi:uncharacterized membrane protein YgcG
MRARVVRIALVAAAALLALSDCVSFSSGYERIDSFDVDYTIAHNGTVQAVETIAYDFAGEKNKHGIDRFLASRFGSGDGKDRVYRYDNISVTSPSGASALFSTTLSNALQIRIGNKNATLNGKQVYVISYDIAGALNRAAQGDGSFLDEFYWNATGNYWNVPIARTTITVHGAGDVSKIACFAGAQGSQLACADAKQSGGSATFQHGFLGANEGVTMDVGFPDGTFATTDPIVDNSLPVDAIPVTSGSNDGPDPFWSPWNWGTGLALLFGIPIAFGLLVVARKRDQEFVGVTPGTVPADPSTAPVGVAPLEETVVVYYQPPQGFPVGAANTVLNKKRKTVDVTATLIDLAVRGHLRIEEIEGGRGNRAKDYNLVATPERAAEKKARARTGGVDAAELLPHEALLLGKLFKGHSTEVTLSSLTNKFANDMRAITTSLDAWIENQKFFIDKLNRIHPILAWPLALAVPVFIVMTFVPGGWFLIPVGGAIGSLIGMRSSSKAVRRSATGHALYLQVEGFRQYIATAEADRIRFDETEDVFSRYMPWAIVFGEADRWARVFRELAEQGRFAEQPDWYVGNGFSTGYLVGSIASISSIGSAVNSFSSLAASSMTSTPSSGGSSGFSGGGGSSGGGGGGGGGGSW